MTAIPISVLRDSLRAEARQPLDTIVTDAPTKSTQIIAIYGKGGIGKSFTLANLSYMMAQQGKKVLLIGCDPKSDTTSLLFGGKATPTIIETSSRKKLAGEQIAIGDVCFKRDGVFAMELGGPEVGRGCGGRGIIHGFETLEKLGFHDWGFDFVLLDFLGDVVCGGFGLPIARDMCQKVIVVGSNDLQSLYVANNVCSAVEYFRKLGGNVGVAGMVINKDDGTGEAQAFATNAGIPVLASIPAHDDIRRKSASYEIIGRPDGVWGALFAELATNVAEAPPRRPKPQTQDQLLSLFSGSAVGRDVVLQPATLVDIQQLLLAGPPAGRGRRSWSCGRRTETIRMGTTPVSCRRSGIAGASARRVREADHADRTDCPSHPEAPARFLLGSVGRAPEVAPSDCAGRHDRRTDHSAACQIASACTERARPSRRRACALWACGRGVVRSDTAGFRRPALRTGSVWTARAREWVAGGVPRDHGAGGAAPRAAVGVRRM